MEKELTQEQREFLLSLNPRALDAACKAEKHKDGKDYYEAHKERLIARRLKRAKEQVDTLREYKKAHGCAICGYNKTGAALCFHHPEGVEKSFMVGHDAASFSMERLMIEARKCTILCKNCHAEIHSDEGK